MARFNINPKMLNTSSSPLFNQTRNEEFYAAKLVEFYQYLALGWAIIITLTVIVFAATYTSVRIQKISKQFASHGRRGNLTISWRDERFKLTREIQ